MTLKAEFRPARLNVSVEENALGADLGAPVARYVIEPYVSIEETEDGAIITCTAQGQTTTGEIYNGKDGADGAKGDKGDAGEKGDKGDKGDAGTTDYNELQNKPNLAAVATSGSYNDLEDIPPAVNDLGNIDPSEYEDDRDVFLNTLLDDGIYRFVWEDGDDYELYVVVESMLDCGYVYQKYWCSEEGSKYQYHCALIIEDGEVIERYANTYMTLSDASDMFSTKTHAHYDSNNGAMSVFDWCDSNALTFDNAKPFILYTDTLNNKNWVIERYASVRQPKYRFIRVYDMSDASHFYIRSGSVIGNTTTWDNWYKFTGTVFTP